MREKNVKKKRELPVFPPHRIVELLQLYHPRHPSYVAVIYPTHSSLSDYSRVWD